MLNNLLGRAGGAVAHNVDRAAGVGAAAGGSVGSTSVAGAAAADPGRVAAQFSSSKMAWPVLGCSCWCCWQQGTYQTSTHQLTDGQVLSRGVHRVGRTPYAAAAVVVAGAAAAAGCWPAKVFVCQTATWVSPRYDILLSVGGSWGPARHTAGCSPTLDT